MRTCERGANGGANGGTNGGAKVEANVGECTHVHTPYPGHRLLIQINILEIHQYFSFSKNIDFCIDFTIDLGIDSETAKFDQI